MCLSVHGSIYFPLAAGGGRELLAILAMSDDGCS